MLRVVNAVALGLLLNWGPRSSIDNTLFPDDSVKSVRILLLKIISLERILFPSLKFRLFSVAISKSNTQLVSTNPSRLLTTVTSVKSVDQSYNHTWTCRFYLQISKLLKSKSMICRGNNIFPSIKRNSALQRV